MINIIELVVRGIKTIIKTLFHNFKKIKENEIFRARCGRYKETQIKLLEMENTINVRDENYTGWD